MHLKPVKWTHAWKEYTRSAPSTKNLLNEASPGFVHGVNKWIDVITDGGEFTLNEVLPWNDIFGGDLRVAIPGASQDDTNLAKIVGALVADGWNIPIQPDAGTARRFRLNKVKQKKRRAGGEVYEEDDWVAKLDIVKRDRKQIPKGPRQGEWIVKDVPSTMSRAINKATKVDDDVPSYISPELAEWWQKKQTFYTKGDHWKKIEKLFKEPEAAKTIGSDQMIVLSRHPIDVLRMGDVETVGARGTAGKIGACHREGGEYAHCAQQEALGHGPIAYLVPRKELDFLLSGDNQEERTKNYLDDEGPGKPKYKISDFDNKEIFNDRDRDITGMKVLNRLRLRQFRDNEINEMWAVPEKRVYPSFDAVPGFLEAVREWAWDRQKETYEEAYEHGTFPSMDALERLGGKYGDTQDGTLLNLFFQRSGGEPAYHPDMNVQHEHEGAEELEPDPEMIAEQWDDRVQEILETMNGRMEHASVYAEVEVIDQNPYVMMSAGLTLEFNEDLFGDDGGAEYELPTGYGDPGYNDLTSEIIEALRDQIHVYADDADINDWQNTISFNFNIHNEDYDSTPEGFDSFADYVESEWDNKYDEIRQVIKRVLIKEEYMGADAYEKLARSLRAKAEERDLADAPAYKHWDFDEDGNEITFTLKDPATLVATPEFYGLYLGTIPRSMDLSYVLRDWKYRESKEFRERLIPKIRALFADAEKSALQQLDLPGVEAKETHQLLLPAKAEFRLKQKFDDYSEPASIYLQVKIEIDEDITDEQVEEIELFIKYLDEDSKIDILEKAAEETFQEFLQPALKRKKAEEKIQLFGDDIRPLLQKLPLKELMNFIGALPGMSDSYDVSNAMYTITANLKMLGPAAQSGQPSTQFVEVLSKRWTRNMLLRAAAALPTAEDWTWHDARNPHATQFRSTEEIEEKMEELYGEANKILGIRLQDSLGAGRSDWDPARILDLTSTAIDTLTATGLGQISRTFNTIMKDPAQVGGMELLKDILTPDYAPSWYPAMLSKAGISAEKVVNLFPALDSPRTQAHDDLTAELMKLLSVRESIRLVDKINVLLQESPKPKKIRIRIKRR